MQLFTGTYFMPKPT